MELKMLSEESLTQPPEEVFDILNKLGEGSYGSVYKAAIKKSGDVVAIKLVPVETDLQDIIKEVSIMQQCDSPYVVKYYGSYFKNSDLWIVMEYCGAGSVLDIMRLRGTFHGLARGRVKTLTEEEISAILCDTLKGLEYLHLRKKIHRDIKAGNILLNSDGLAKLADFGVAGQLTDTMVKRNTRIGTPFWMAPEVIQEIGYDCAADMWSLGITALEMAEGKAPYGDIHPMRAMFMIPSRPPPSLCQPDSWSPAFLDFVSRCLVKSPEERASASELLQHEFIRGQKSTDILAVIIDEAEQVRERFASTAGTSFADDRTLISRTSGTTEDAATLIRNGTAADDDGTMIQHSTLVPDGRAVTDLESNLGTMVINEEDEDSMRIHSGVESREFRPPFLDHFGRAADVHKQQHVAGVENNVVVPDSNSEEAQLMRLRLEQISGGVGPQVDPTVLGSDPVYADRVQAAMQETEVDLSFVKFLSNEELASRMANLDLEMEREIDNLRRLYHAKRQPILDAVDKQRKGQQKF